MRRHVLIAVAVVLAAPAPAAAAAPARLGKAWFESQRQVIIVPFTGRPPDAKYYRLNGKRHYWEFQGARLADQAVQHHPVESTLKRYTIAQRTPDVVRLAFELEIDAEPSLRFDAPHQRFEIFPFGAELSSNEPVVRVPRHLPLPLVPKAPPRRPPTPEPSWMPAPVLRVPRGLSLPTLAPRTLFGRPEAGAGGLLMSFAGTAPDYKVRVLQANPRWLYFEFDQSGLDPQATAGKRFGVVQGHGIDAWMFTLPAPGKVRLYLRLKRTTPIGAQVLEGEGRIRFAAPGGPVAPAVPAPPLSPKPIPTQVPPDPASPIPATPASAVPTLPPGQPLIPDAPAPATPVPPSPPSEPDALPPDGAGPLLFPRPDSAD